MTVKEFDRMKQVHDYVFSTPPNSLEREKRLSEISKEDDEKLWDFHCGLRSGRIKRPEIKESEENKMDTTKRIRNYTEFRSAWGKNYHQLAELNQRCPELYGAYKERMEKEKLKESDPAAYYLKYGVTAKEV